MIDERMRQTFTSAFLIALQRDLFEDKRSIADSATPESIAVLREPCCDGVPAFEPNDDMLLALCCRFVHIHGYNIHLNIGHTPKVTS